ncbi:Calx-beta domain-containing protein [Vibrio sp. SNU_ST1]|uniref:Calx-beta domain-containing protein n=2 Tax=unclassified Vibrio TaxID=2614977 RepID=UPI00272C4D58|nr:Calx-beta domain-containing protein [Vibrio sp. SNU_ST1]WKY59255.1 Calx-beta domain-containing protein [Vibrio sp. SNU_ST1]
MDMTVLNASGALALGQRIVISIDGTIKVLEDGQPLQAGDVVLESQNANSESQISVKRFTPEGKDGDEVDLDQDIENIFAALEEGQDPTELGEEFATAAGVRGSSLVSSGTIERDGDETIPVTEFVTTGFEGLGLSRTQSLSLLDLFRSIEVEPTVSIEDSQIINEGSTAIFEISLSKAASGDVSITLETLYGTATADDITSVVVKNAVGNVVTPNADGSYTVKAGETKLVVEVATKDDGTFEGDEKLSLKVTGATGVTGTGTGELTIKDDGTGPVDPTNPNPDDRPTVSIEDSKVINEGSTASFDVSLSKAASVDVSITLETLYGTATADDITSIVVKDAAGNVVTPNADGSYTVKAGETKLVVEVQTKDDGTFEGDEKLSLKVTGVTGATGTGTGELTIKDDGTGPVDPTNPNPDDRPTVSIEDSKVINEGSTASFDVSLTKAASVDVSITLETLYGTATADDISSIVVKDAAGNVVTANADGSYTVKAGETKLIVEVATKDDGTYEGDEKLSLKVTGATGVTGTGTGELTIKDDGTGPVDPTDPTPPVNPDDRPSVSIEGSKSINEGSTASFDVTLTKAAVVDVTVDIETLYGTATADDITSVVVKDAAGNVVTPNADGSYTVKAGETKLTVEVATKDDGTYEGDEKLSLKVTGATGVTGTDSSDLTIKDDGTGPVDPTNPPVNPDDRPSVSIEDSKSINEGSTASFDVTLTKAAAVDVSVTLETLYGTATADDITSIVVKDSAGNVVSANADGSYTVKAGETKLTVEVATKDDATYEGDEKLSLKVTGATGVTGTDSSDLTIKDDGTGPVDPTNPNPDDRPSVSIEDSKSINEGSTASFDVSLSKAASVDVSVTLETLYGTATADDVTSVVVKDAAGNVVTPNADGSYTVKAGETKLTVEVATKDDATYEGDEKLSLKVTGAMGVTGSDSSELTIKDDGTGPVDPGKPTDNDKPTLTVGDAAPVVEGQSASFTVSLSNAVDADLTYKFDLDVSDSAEIADFVATGGKVMLNVSYTVDGQTVNTTVENGKTLSIPGNATGMTVAVATQDDPYLEGTENFKLSVNVSGTVGDASNALNISDVGTGTITDESAPTGEDTVTVTLNGPDSIVEGATSTDYTVTLSDKVPAGTVITLAYEYKTASGDDIVETLQATVNADGTTATFNIATVDDKLAEGSETFVVKVTGVKTSGGADVFEKLNLTGASKETSITDESAPTGEDTVTVTLNGPDSIVEGATSTDYTVTLSDKVPAGTVITLAYEYKTASGDDIVETLQATVNADGKTATFNIATVDDKLAEGSETFVVKVTGVKTSGGADVFEKLNLTGASKETSITDESAPTGEDTVTVTLNGPDSIVEGATSTDYTVTLSDKVPAGTVITLAYEYKTASGDDIVETLQATVNADGKTATFNIATVDDKLAEGSETFVVKVTGVKTSGGADVFEKLNLTGASKETSITDESAPTGEDTVTVTLNGPDSIVEGATSTDYTVTLSDKVPAGTVITLAYEYKTASGDDIVETLQATVNADGKTATFNIATVDDKLAEGSETFVVKVTGVKTSGGADVFEKLNLTGASKETSITDESAPTGEDTVTVTLNGPDSIVEGATSTDYTVTLSDKVPAGTVITLAYEYKTASGDDIVETLQATVNADGKTATFNIVTVDDKLAEGSETFVVKVTGVKTSGGADVFEKLNLTGASKETSITDESAPTGEDTVTVTLNGPDSIVEGATSTDYTVTLSDKVPAGTVITLAYEYKTASGDDIVETLQATVNADGKTATFNIATVDDKLAEGSETFVVKVTGVKTSGGADVFEKLNLTGASKETSITDESAPTGEDTVTVTLNGPDSIVEGATSTDYTVTLSDKVPAGTVITLAYEYKTASGDDIVETLQATVNADGKTATFNIATVDDKLAEGSETFVVKVTGVKTSGGADVFEKLNLTGASKETSITDESAPTGEDTVTVTLNGPDSIVEGATSTDYTVTLSDKVPAGTVITLAYEYKTASGDDIVETLQATVNADGKTATFNIATVDDKLAEGSETFVVKVTGVKTSGGADVFEKLNLTGASKETSITDESAPTGEDTVTVTLNGPDSIVEGATSTDYTVTLSDKVPAGTVITLAYEYKTASGDDIVETLQATVNADGKTATFNIATVDDKLAEGSETFVVKVTGVKTSGGADVFEKLNLTGASKETSITDESAPTGEDTVTVTLNGPDSIVEGATSTDYTVTLSDKVPAGTVITLAYEYKTASGDDIVETLQATVNADGTTATFNIATVDDKLAEGSETFVVKVTGVKTSGGADVFEKLNLTGASKETSITDESAPTGEDTVTVTLNGPDSIVEGATSTDYTVTLSDKVPAGTVITLAYEYKTASGDDIVETLQATVNADGKTATFNIATVDDKLAEGSETFVVKVTGVKTTGGADVFEKLNLTGASKETSITDESAPTGEDTVTVTLNGPDSIVEGATSTDYTVTLSDKVPAGTVITLAYEYKTASGDDIVETLQATVNADGKTATFNIATVDDKLAEGSETFVVKVTGVKTSGGADVFEKLNLTGASKETSITDESAPTGEDTVTVTLNGPDSIVEGATSTDYTVTLSDKVPAGTVITLAYEYKTASGDDIVETLQATVNADGKTATFNIATVDDKLAEGSETFVVKVTGVKTTGGADVFEKLNLTGASKETSITDESAPTGEDTVTVTLNGPDSIVEGATSTDYTVTLSDKVPAGTVITLAYEYKTASGDDIVETLQATVNADGTTATFNIATVDDKLAEGSETFVVKVTGVKTSGGADVFEKLNLTGASKETSITDESAPTGEDTVTVTLNGPDSIVEGATSTDYTVTLSDKVPAGTVITLAYEYKTASGDDIVETLQATVNADGKTATFNIATVDDKLAEGSETFVVKVTGVKTTGGADVFEKLNLTGASKETSITDESAPTGEDTVTVTLNGPDSIVEGATSTDYTVTLSDKVPAGTVITLAYEYKTASGDDIVETLQATVNADGTTATFNIATVDDKLAEGSETFVVKVTGVKTSGGADVFEKLNLTGASKETSITDESAPTGEDTVTVTLNGPDSIVEGATSTDYTVTLSDKVPAGTVITLAYEYKTASGDDIVETLQATVNADGKTATFNIATVDDKLAEGSETFVVKVTGVKTSGGADVFEKLNLTGASKETSITDESAPTGEDTVTVTLNGPDSIVEGATSTDYTVTLSDKVPAGTVITLAYEYKTASGDDIVETLQATVNADGTTATFNIATVDDKLAEGSETFVVKVTGVKTSGGADVFEKLNLTGASKETSITDESAPTGEDTVTVTLNGPDSIVEGATSTDYTVTLSDKVPAGTVITLAYEYKTASGDDIVETLQATVNADGKTATFNIATVDDKLAEGSETFVVKVTGVKTSGGADVFEKLNLTGASKETSITDESAPTGEDTVTVTLNGPDSIVEGATSTDYTVTLSDKVPAGTVITLAYEYKTASGDDIVETLQATVNADGKTATFNIATVDDKLAEGSETFVVKVTGVKTSGGADVFEKLNLTGASKETSITDESAPTGEDTVTVTLNGPDSIVEGATSTDYTVTLSDKVPAGTVITLAYEYKTASGDDIVETLQATVNADGKTATFNIATVDDKLAEGSETFVVKVTGVKTSGGADVFEKLNLTGASKETSITDESAPTGEDTVTVTLNGPDSIVEGATSTDYTVTLSDKVPAGTVITLAYEYKTASGDDIVETLQATVNADGTTATFNIATVDDKLAEGSETFVVKVTGVKTSGGADVFEKLNLTGASKETSITDESAPTGEDTVTVTLNGPDSIVEGATSTDYTVTLSDKVPAGTVITLAYEYKTASGDDIVETLQATVNADGKTATFNIATVDDKLAEGSETFVVKVTGVKTSGGADVFEKLNLTGASKETSITDESAPTGEDTVTVTLNGPDSIVEGATSTDYTVTLSDKVPAGTVITLAYEYKTASGDDIVETLQATVNADGKTATFNIATVDDKLAEGSETFVVKVTGVKTSGGADVFEKLNLTGASKETSITDESAPTGEDTVTVTLNGPDSIVEGATSTDYTVTLSDKVPAGTVITLAYEYKTASGDDIVETLQATVNADGKTATFNIATVDDKLAEGSETFVVKVTGVKTSGGADVFEKLNLTGASKETSITDESAPTGEDTVTVTLNGPDSIVEGATSADYTVTLSDKVPAGTVITLAYEYKTASGDDIVETLQATVNADGKTATFNIATVDDKLAEGSETFVVKVTGVKTSGGADVFEKLNLTGASKETSITDESAPTGEDTVTVTLNGPDSIVEGATSTDYTVTLSDKVPAGTVITLAYEYKTASGDDIVETLQATVNADGKTATFNIATVDDKLAEGSETFVVKVTGVKTSGGADVFEKLNLTGASKETSITDESAPTGEDTVTVTLNGPDSIVEGATSTDYTVTLSDKVPAGTVITLAYEYKTASGDDIVETLQATVNADGKTATFNIATVDDKLAEGSETFVVKVTGVKTSGGADVFEKLNLTGASKETSITDESAPTGEDTVTVTLNGPDSIVEGATSADYTVTLSDKVPAGTVITLAYEYKTASGDDIVETLQATVNADGKTATFNIATVDDKLAEGSETFVVKVTGVKTSGGADVFEKLNLTGASKETSITDESAPTGEDTVTVTLNGPDSIVEGATSTDYTVTLSDKVPAGTVITLAYEYKTASGDDIVETLQATVNADGKTATFNIATVDDKLAEGSETFVVKVTGVKTSGGADVFEKLNLTGASKETSITDESAPTGEDTVTVTLNGPDSIVEGATSTDYTVTLSDKVPAGTVITLAYEYKTASGDDIVETLQATVNADGKTATFNIATVDDKLAEGSETFVVKVTGVKTSGGADVFEKLNLTGASKETSITDESAPTGEDTVTVTLNGPDSIVEGATSTDYTVTLSDKVPAGTVITLAYEYKTASGDDIVETLQATVNADGTTATFNIATVDDKLAEGSETFVVKVTGVKTSGGADVFEKLNLTGASKETSITDESAPTGEDTVTVTLNGPDSIVEGATSTDYTVTLSDKVPAGTVITLAYEYKTASGDDIVETLQATVNADGKTATFNIATVDDKLAEGSETFVVKVTGVKTSGGADVFEKLNLTGASKETSITDESAPTGEDTVTVTLNGPDSIVEGATSTDYTVTLSDKVPAGTVITLAYEYKTASGDDIVETLQATVNADGTTATFNIATVDDKLAEGSETFVVKVTGVKTSGGADVFEKLNLTGASKETSITDHDVTIKVHDAAPVDEGDKASFKVTLNEASSEKQYVKFEATTNGYDTEFDDIDTNSLTYEYKDNNGVFQVANVVNGFVEIPAGITELRVTVQTVQDDKFEWTERFGLHIVDTKSQVGGTSSIDEANSDLKGQGTIKLDHTDNPTLTLTNADAVDEGSTAVFDGHLSKVSEASIDMKVEFEFSNGAGKANLADLASDISKPFAGVTVTYISGGIIKTISVNEVDGTFTLPAKVTDFKVNVDTVNDNRFETSEDFGIKLSEIPFQSSTDASKDVIINHGQHGVSATGSINEDASDKPSVNVANARAVIEGGALEYSVLLTGSSDVDVTYSFNFPNSSDVRKADISFTDGVKLSADKQSIIVPKGVSYFKVIVPTLDDVLVENTENYTITIGGDTGTGSILDNEVAPVIKNQSVSVSEEGLAGGITDTGGLSTDSTDGHSIQGNLVITDANNNLSDTVFSETSSINITTSTGQPLTSEGHTIVWAVSPDGHALTGTANGNVVIEATLDRNGHYEIQLKAPVDHPNINGEDNLVIQIPVIAKDTSGLKSSGGQITVSIEDDQPVATDIDVAVTPETKSDTNIQLVIDVSGSMGYDSDVSGKSRLDILKESLAKMLQQYDTLGDVKVQIVTFTGNAKLIHDGSKSWFSVSEAISQINKLKPKNNTDYDDALVKARTSWDHDEDSRLPDANNVSYFITDGVPNQNDRIDSWEAKAWTKHLNENGITSQAIGIKGGSLDKGQIDLVSHDGLTGTDSSAIVIGTSNELTDILTQPIIQTVTGSLVTNGGFGADGGYVSQLVIDGVTFNFDGTTIRSTGQNSKISFTKNESTNELKVTVDGKYTLSIDMDTGSYKFGGKPQARPETVDFDYTFKDGDGDTSSSNISFDVMGSKGSVDVSSTGKMIDSVKVLHDNLSWIGSPAVTNGQAGYNKIVDNVDINKGVSINVGDAGDAVWTGQGDDVIYLGDSHAVLDQNTGQASNQDAINTYIKDVFTQGRDSNVILNPNQGEDSEMAATNNSTANLDVAHGGGGSDYIYGEGGSDVIFGGSGDDVIDGGEGTDGLRGGTGNDTLKGGAGDDILIGGIGNDILTGGSDDDIFKFVDQGSGVRHGEKDTITDFTKGDDKIDISDLLHTDSSDSINSLLQSSKIGISLEGADNMSTADLKLTVTDGGKTQEIILQDSAEQFDSYITNGSISDVNGLLNDILKIYDN